LLILEGEATKCFFLKFVPVLINVPMYTIQNESYMGDSHQETGIPFERLIQSVMTTRNRGVQIRTALEHGPALSERPLSIVVDNPSSDTTAGIAATVEPHRPLGATTETNENFKTLLTPCQSASVLPGLQVNSLSGT
jgi:hypothetical protein